jgi:demethylmenaquinone methyltransferase/2-methoxy-6-polyprenyl-1,4-benzoquinol methylase
MGKPAGKKYPPAAEMTDAEYIHVVREIFSTITEKYDFLNHFLSVRQDIAWRRAAAKKMHFFHTHRFLDVATGTADMAIEAAQVHPRIRVIGMDFVRKMVDVGRAKIKRRHLSDRIRLVMSDALHLPFNDSSFDVAGIAFGIRNIPNKVCVLREMNRVVVPGGQVMVLEMTVPRNRLLRGIYRTYLNRMMPTLARAFSPNPAAYRYLADSIRHFPSAGDFVRLMGQAGIKSVKNFPLTLGITHLYLGIKST